MDKLLKDPVHNYIRLSQNDLSIVDTPCFQRLRNIHHVGTAYLTYPGATHTRFEHSLGVAELGSAVINQIIDNCKGEVVDSLKSSRKKDSIIKTLRMACLLHDVGHSPYSHVTECYFEDEAKNFAKQLASKITLDTRSSKTTEQALVEKASNSPHEMMSCAVVLTQYDNKLKKMGIDPLDVVPIILGKIRDNGDGMDLRIKRFIADILSSPIDVDKFDYLLRDNYMTGATQAAIDKSRLLSAYSVYGDGSLILCGKALSLVSNLINARQQAFMWIYQHHKVVYTDTLLRRMIDILIEENLIEYEKYFSLNALTNDLVDDYEILMQIRSNAPKNKELGHLYKSWISRDFLSPCWKNGIEFCRTIADDEIRKDLILDSRSKTHELEDQIMKKFKLSDGEVIVSYAKFTPFSPAGLDIPIDMGGSRVKAVSDLKLHPLEMDKYSNVPYIYVPKKPLDIKQKVIHYLQTPAY